MYYIDKLRELRKERRYSQKDMAELLETTQQQYSKYENKQQEMPIRHLITICKHFQISADWLLDLNINNQEGIIDFHNFRIQGAAGAAKSNYIAQVFQNLNGEENK